MTLLELIYANDHDLLEQVEAMLATGVDRDRETEYGETPVGVASKNARFDVVRRLIEAGADRARLGWTAVHRAVVWGTDKALAVALAEGASVDAREAWGRTPLHLAIEIGSRDKATSLIDAGADLAARGHCGRPPIAYATTLDNAEALRWLVELGADVNETDDLAQTPLMIAVVNGARQCVEALIEVGADVFAEDDIPCRAIRMTDDPAITALLLAAGEDLNALSRRQRADFTGLADSPIPEVSVNDYFRARHRRFGRSNPERVNEPFWQMMIRTGSSAWAAREQFEGDTPPGQPVWTLDRFGMSITSLGDGRTVEIAGEHEDHYDPDFCIYNDVFVHDGSGNCDVYLYPPEVFPPTDFHTATLAGDKIWIVGNLGYPPDRRPAATPVYTLDIETLEIAAVETTGNHAGSISDHRAKLEGDELVIRGGKLIGIGVDGEQTYEDDSAAWSLSLVTRRWTRLPPT